MAEPEFEPSSSGFAVHILSHQAVEDELDLPGVAPEGRIEPVSRSDSKAHFHLL